LKSKEKILKLETRKIIHDFILNHPGVHKNKIIRKLDFSEGTIRYHIIKLQKEGYISEKILVGYSRYYPTNKIGRLEKEILGILRQDVPRYILLYSLISLGVTQAQLSKELNMIPKAVQYHLKKLKHLDLIELAVFKNKKLLINGKETLIYNRLPAGNEKIYCLKNPYMIYNLVVKYRDSYLDDEISKDIIDWLEFVRRDAKVKKIDTIEKQEEKIKDIFSEILPFPLCA
jgi:predicted ArsR family transcriptional regulator